MFWKNLKHNQINCYKRIQHFSRFICIIHPVVVSQYKPIYVLLSRLLHQKYKNLKHMLTGLIKFVVVDGNIVSTLVEWTGPDSHWLLQNSNQWEKRNQGCTLERFLGFIDTETGHKSEVLESRIRLMMVMMIKTIMVMIINSKYMLQVLCNLTCFFDHLWSTQYHRSVLITLSV